MEAEEFAVEGLEVRVAEDRASAGSFEALGTALAGGHLQFLVGSTFDRLAAHLRAADVAANAAAAAAGSHVPGLVVHVGDALGGALAAHLGHNAARTAAVLLLKLRCTLQYGACGTLANRCAVQAGAISAAIRRKLRLVVVQLIVEYALACNDKWVKANL